MVIDEATGPAIRSSLLARAGFHHGFSTRLGGCSTGDFASLNLGGSVGDDPALVEENHQRLAAHAGLDRRRFRSAVQIHGSRVIALEGEEPLPPGTEADGIAAFAAGLAPAVRTADCVPLLLASPSRGWVAAVHAGWRGTMARIAAAAVELLAARGVDPAELVAAVGPAIGPCCYEVSPELAEAFRGAFGAGVGAGRMIDLAEANRLALVEAGLDEGRVEVLGLCTACDSTRFFSHRRDRGRTGRHLSFIVSR